MPHFAANLTFLFTEMPFMERFSAARKAGFDAVEFMFPYDYPLDDIKSQLKATGLQLILCNLPAGDWAGGDRGTAGNPERREEFRTGVARGIDAAKALGVSRLNCLVGLKHQALSEGETWETLTDNLRYAAEALGKEGIRLMVEPINHLDIPGFALNTCAQVLKLIEEIHHPNAYLQFDLYHARRENEDVASDPPRPSRTDRAYPGGRLSGPPPAGHRRDGLPFPFFGNRPPRLPGFCFAGVHPHAGYADLPRVAGGVRL